MSGSLLEAWEELFSPRSHSRSPQPRESGPPGCVGLTSHSWGRLGTATALTPHEDQGAPQSWLRRRPACVSVTVSEALPELYASLNTH